MGTGALAREGAGAPSLSASFTEAVVLLPESMLSHQALTGSCLSLLVPLRAGWGWGWRRVDGGVRSPSPQLALPKLWLLGGSCVIWGESPGVGSGAAGRGFCQAPRSCSCWGGNVPCTEAGECPRFIPRRSPGVSPVGCNEQGALWNREEAFCCLLKIILLWKSKEGKLLDERGSGETAYVAGSGVGHAARAAPGGAERVPGGARAGALVTGAELTARAFINILGAGKAGWVLMAVLLDSFCKDLYHSVSV